MPFHITRTSSRLRQYPTYAQVCSLNSDLAKEVFKSYPGIENTTRVTRADAATLGQEAEQAFVALQGALRARRKLRLKAAAGAVVAAAGVGGLVPLIGGGSTAEPLVATTQSATMQARPVAGLGMSSSAERTGSLQVEL